MSENSTKDKSTAVDSMNNFLHKTLEESKHGNCLVKFVGSIVVKDNEIYGKGHNATPEGTLNCMDGGCNGCKHYMEEKDKKWLKADECVCVHAEDNAIKAAKLAHADLTGATIYINVPPCMECAKLIQGSGITKMVCFKPDHDCVGVVFLRENHVEVVYL
jgi:dCMP deaminase